MNSQFVKLLGFTIHYFILIYLLKQITNGMVIELSRSYTLQLTIPAIPTFSTHSYAAKLQVYINYKIFPVIESVICWNYYKISS